MSVVIDTLEEVERQIIVQSNERITYIIPILESLEGLRKRTILLAGEGAEASIVGLYLGTGKNALQIQIDTTHAAPNTKGHTLFKAVLAEQSSLDFFGMIKIASGAQGSNDFLQQDSLLLSNDAKANAVPGLEIEANDVKASHGATAKPVDPEQKFYLLSRGLTESEAETMIVHGFLASVIAAIPDELWRNRINHALDRLL